MIHVGILWWTLMLAAGLSYEAHVPKTVPYHDGSQRAALWFDCEHEAASRWVAGTDPDRPDWLRAGAAECVARRGYPAEAERGKPEASE